MLLAQDNSSRIQNIEKYFHYFGHKLYDSSIDSEENYEKYLPESQEFTDNSSTNYSNTSQKDFSDDEEKYIPLNLFNTTPSKQQQPFLSDKKNEINPE